MSIIGATTARASNTQTRDTKESVLDLIIDSAPYDTPLLAMARRGKAPNNITHEWVIDYGGAYPTSVSVTGEGDDVTPAATASRVVMKNHSHIIGKAWAVTDTQEVVDTHGIESEFAYQEAKNGKLLVRDFNYALMNSTIATDSGTPNNWTTERKMGGLIDQIKTPASYYSQGTLATAAQGNTDTWTTADTPTADELLDIMQACWEDGGMANGEIHVLANGAMKRAISELFAANTGANTVYRRQFGEESKALVLPVDHIVTDFGDLLLHLDRSVPSGTVVGFDPEFFEINVLRDFTSKEMGTVGFAKTGAVEAEMTCSLLAPNTAWVIENA